MTVTRFLPGGEIRKICETKDPEVFSGSFGRRASHVEPADLLPRILFHCIRRFVSDESRLAEYTRSWSCVWRARILNGPTLGPFTDRAEAIEAELRWLHTYWILEGINQEETKHGSDSCL